MTVARDNRITSSFFSGDDKNAYEYILNVSIRTGEMPTIRAFRDRFPHYKLEKNEDGEIGTEENLKFWIDELRRKKKQNYLADCIEESAALLQEKDSDKAMEIIKKGLLYLETEIEETDDVDITKDLDVRKEEYLKKKKNKGMMGIPTGFKFLDYMLKGLVNETLTTLIANTGVGKEQPLSSKVLTPDGFTTMGNMKVGSHVVSEFGESQRVSAIFPQGVKPVYELTFQDGSKARCGLEHLWKVKTTDDLVRGNDWRVLTLSEIMKLPLKRGKGYNLFMPVCKPVQFNVKSNLPVSPYVLGCLLGDGGFTTDRITFSNPEKDILERLSKELSSWGSWVYHKGTNCQYVFKSNEFKCNKLYRTIKSLNLTGVSSKDKFIPKSYLHASIEDRSELLKGLFDTDGNVSLNGSKSFSTCSKSLAEDFSYLANSLGIRVTSNIHNREDEGKSVEYVIRLLTDEVIYSSSKHKYRVGEQGVPSHPRHYELTKVTSIEYVGEEECQCIMVDSPDHTYITDNFIVTHNTWFEVIISSFAMVNGYKVLQFVTEMPEKQMRDRYEVVLYAMTHGAINYSHFKSGKLSTEQEKDYFDFLDSDLAEMTPLELITATSPMQVEANIEKYNPDLVMIDGVYLMEDDEGSDSDWLRIAHITRDLKKIAKRKKKPIFINSQLDKSTSKKTGAELENISYSQAIGQDSDNVMALFRTPLMYSDHEMCVKLLKTREGSTGKLTMTWDFSNMQFEEIYNEKSDGGEISDKEDNDEEIEEDDSSFVDVNRGGK
jgi:replicative DNA helicase